MKEFFTGFYYNIEEITFATARQYKKPLLDTSACRLSSTVNFYWAKINMKKLPIKLNNFQKKLNNPQQNFQ